jgi:hypothetical protein
MRYGFGLIKGSLPHKQESAREAHSREPLFHIEIFVPTCYDKVDKVLKMNALNFVMGPRPELKVEGNEPVSNGICDC